MASRCDTAEEWTRDRADARNRTNRPGKRSNEVVDDSTRSALGCIQCRRRSHEPGEQAIRGVAIDADPIRVRALVDGARIV
jgi:hypothetical protein